MSGLGLANIVYFMRRYKRWIFKIWNYHNIQCLFLWYDMSCLCLHDSKNTAIKISFHEYYGYSRYSFYIYGVTSSFIGFLLLKSEHKSSKVLFLAAYNKKGGKYTHQISRIVWG